MGWGEGHYHYLSFSPSLGFVRFTYFSLFEKIATLSAYLEVPQIFASSTQKISCIQRSTLYTQNHKSLHCIG